MEKEAAEVPQRDPVATEVLCRPEVLCEKRKQQRYPDGTLLQQRYVIFFMGEKELELRN